MNKLSKTQLNVLRLMSEGWELGSYPIQIGFTRIVEHAVLQKHGLGHGDPMEKVNIRTINALLRKKLIRFPSNPHPMIETTRYWLTEKGRNVATSLSAGACENL